PPRATLLPYTTLFRSSQRHKTHAMGEFLQHIAPKGQGQACLADARCAGQGEHAHPGTCEPGTHCLEYLLAPNEWCERVRQSGVRSEEHTSELQSPDHL